MTFLIPMFLLLLMSCTLGASRNITQCTIKGISNSSEYCEKSRTRAINCKDRDLQTVPKAYPLVNSSKLCRLDLSNNNITRLTDGSFMNATNLTPETLRILVLENNNMVSVSAGAFEGLYQLQALSLKSNKLFQEGLQKGVFKFTPALVALNLKSNKLTFDGFDEEVGELVNLSRLAINPVSENFTFGPMFRNLSKLSVITFSARKKGDCDLGTLRNDTFDNVPDITNLSLSFCNVINISEEVFKPLQRIWELDISYNQALKFEGMNRALAGLRNSTTLKTLNVKRVHVVIERGVEVYLTDLANLKTLKNLETLYMGLNKIEVFDKHIFDNDKYSLPPNLRYISLDGNRLTYGRYVDRLFRIKSLETVDISRQHLSVDPFFYQSNDDNTVESVLKGGGVSNARIGQIVSAINSSGVQTEVFKADLRVNCTCDVNHGKNLMCLPSGVKTVLWKKSTISIKLTPFLLCGADSIKHVDLSQNTIQKWIGPVFGLNSLETLVITDNFCLNVTYTAFLAFTKLVHLNISGNLFHRSFDPELYPLAFKMFINLNNLRTLDISRSRLYALPVTIFNYLPNLENLYLADNELATFEANLNKCQNLRRLDLHFNILYTLPESLTNHLDALAERKKIDLILNYNPIECTCANIPFLRWTINTKVNVNLKRTLCKIGGVQYHLHRRGNRSSVIEKLEDLCKDKSWITWSVGSASVVVGMSLSLVTCILVYKNRWKLRYLYYNRNRRFKHAGYERLFSSDAVVSYSESRASFVKNVVVPALEGQYGLSLWVADRNSLPGVSLADNIAHAIYNSRKTIILIDTDYLAESWCDYEMNMAIVESVESKRKLVIFVLLEQFQTGQLPINVLRFLKNEQSIEYPEDDNDLDAFWRNLVDEIHRV